MIQILREHIAEQEKIVEEAQKKLALLRRKLRACEPPAQHIQDDEAPTHMTRHLNGQCSCGKLTKIQRMLCDMMRIVKMDVSGTQAKSKQHEGVVRSILTQHGFRQLYKHKSSWSEDRLTQEQSHRVAQYIRNLEKSNEIVRTPSLGLEPGMYFIYQPLGSQMPPDFVLINASPEGDVMLALECKSGAHIMWNDSLPKKNYVYLVTDTKRNHTSLFTGDEECLVLLTGQKTLGDLLGIDAHTHDLRMRYKHVQKHEHNLIGMRSFPRSNFSSSHVPPHMREKVFLRACAKFESFSR